MKTFKIGFIVLIATICLSLAYSSYFYRLQAVKLKKENDELKKESFNCLEKIRQLKAMQKTMVIAYGISEWEAKYYAIVFYDFSKHNEVPWEIYPAMLRVESNFRTTLKSPKDAKGLTQLLESTAEPVAQSLGIIYIKGETLWNDLLNLIIGITYISDQIRSGKSNDIQDNVRHGICCYLGGPDYLTKSASNTSTSSYLANYSTTVWQEYSKLIYIYKGVCTEPNLVDSMSDFPLPKAKDTIFQNPENNDLAVSK